MGNANCAYLTASAASSHLDQGHTFLEAFLLHEAPTSAAKNSSVAFYLSQLLENKQLAQQFVIFFYSYDWASDFFANPISSPHRTKIPNQAEDLVYQLYDDSFFVVSSFYKSKISSRHERKHKRSSSSSEDEYSSSHSPPHFGAFTSAAPPQLTLLTRLASVMIPARKLMALQTFELSDIYQQEPFALALICMVLPLFFSSKQYQDYLEEIRVENELRLFEQQQMTVVIEMENPEDNSTTQLNTNTTVHESNELPANSDAPKLKLIKPSRSTSPTPDVTVSYHNQNSNSDKDHNINLYQRKRSSMTTISSQSDKENKNSPTHKNNNLLSAIINSPILKKKSNLTGSDGNPSPTFISRRVFSSFALISFPSFSLLPTPKKIFCSNSNSHTYSPSISPSNNVHFNGDFIEMDVSMSSSKSQVFMLSKLSKSHSQFSVTHDIKGGNRSRCNSNHSTKSKGPSQLHASHKNHNTLMVIEDVENSNKSSLKSFRTSTHASPAAVSLRKTLAPINTNFAKSHDTLDYGNENSNDSVDAAPAIVLTVPQQQQLHFMMMVDDCVHHVFPSSPVQVSLPVRSRLSSTNTHPNQQHGSNNTLSSYNNSLTHLNDNNKENGQSNHSIELHSPLSSPHVVPMALTKDNNAHQKSTESVTNDTNNNNSYYNTFNSTTKSSSAKLLHYFWHKELSFFKASIIAWLDKLPVSISISLATKPYGNKDYISNSDVPSSLGVNSSDKNSLKAKLSASKTSKPTVKMPLKDETFPLIYVNDEFSKLTGYTDSQEVLGRNPRFLQSEECTEMSQVEKMRLCLRDRDVQGGKFVVTNKRKNGTTFKNLVAMKPIFRKGINSNGKKDEPSVHHHSNKKEISLNSMTLGTWGSDKSDDNHTNSMVCVIALHCVVPEEEVTNNEDSSDDDDDSDENSNRYYHHNKADPHNKKNNWFASPTSSSPDHSVSDHRPFSNNIPTYDHNNLSNSNIQSNVPQRRSSLVQPEKDNTIQLKTLRKNNNNTGSPRNYNHSPQSSAASSPKLGAITHKQVHPSNNHHANHTNHHNIQKRALMQLQQKREQQKANLQQSAFDAQWRVMTEKLELIDDLLHILPHLLS